jgi:aminoglycoside phosphotransferase (APT) family kinase protein
VTESDRPSEVALWRCVADTLARTILPALRPGFEQDSARQLFGVGRYALLRPPDRGPARAAQLAPLLGLPPSAGVADVFAEASQGLVAGAAADSVRPLLLDFLAEDVTEAAPLLETFSGHTPAADEPDAVDVPERPALHDWLAARLGERVDDLDVAVMVGGHSRRMLSVGVTSGGRRQDLIVRVEQGGMFGTEGDTEARVMRALAEAGFPTARVRWIESDPSVLGQPFFVMDRVPGTPANDAAMFDEYVRALHRLHQLDPELVSDGLGPVPASPEGAITAVIDHWLDVYRESTVLRIPLLEESAQWLRSNLKPTGGVSVIHGDPGPGNFLHDGGRITALTDWEFAHYGDAAEDWTYFGAIRARKLYDAVGWRAKFAEQAGVSYDDHTWGSWEAFNLFKGACVNLTALRLFREGISTAPNLLAIGSAVHLRFLRQLVERVDGLRTRSVEAVGNV